jgi:hypothetical protein
MTTLETQFLVIVGVPLLALAVAWYNTKKGKR